MVLRFLCGLGDPAHSGCWGRIGNLLSSAYSLKGWCLPGRSSHVHPKWCFTRNLHAPSPVNLTHRINHTENPLPTVQALFHLPNSRAPFSLKPSETLLMRVTAPCASLCCWPYDRAYMNLSTDSTRMQGTLFTNTISHLLLGYGRSLVSVDWWKKGMDEIHADRDKWLI
jgi:hypothetical protein